MQHRLWHAERPGGRRCARPQWRRLPQRHFGQLVTPRAPVAFHQRLVRSLQARILALFLLLLLVVQVGGFMLINTAGIEPARKSVGAEESSPARACSIACCEQEPSAWSRVRGCSPPTTRSARPSPPATAKRSTSVLANHGKRIDATLTMLVGLDQRVIADSIAAHRASASRSPNCSTQAELWQQAPTMVDGARAALPVRHRAGAGAVAGRVGRGRLQGQRRARAGPASPDAARRSRFSAGSAAPRGRSRRARSPSPSAWRCWPT